MESLSHAIDRLLGSLETLASAETTLLASEAWSELAVIQERSVVVVDKIVSLMGLPGAVDKLDSTLFARVRALTQDQGEKIAFLSKQSAAVSEELRNLDKSQQNVRSFLPAYRTHATISPSLSFAAQG